MSVFDESFGDLIQENVVLRRCRHQAACALRSLLWLTGTQFQFDEESGDFAAIARFGVAIECGDRSVELFSLGQRPGFQQQSSRVGLIHFQRTLDELFCFVGFAAFEEALCVIQISLRGFLLLAHHAVKFSQTHLHALVFRLNVEQAVQDFHSFLRAVGLQVRFGNLRKRGRASLSTPC